MNAIMIDNWSMQEIFFNPKFSNITSSLEYRKLLSAIVLWDEIYYPYNEKTSKKYLCYLEKIVKPINDGNKLFEKEAMDIYMRLFQDKEYDLVAKEGLRYLMLSNYKGLDYFPSKTRSLFFEKNNPINIMRKLNRLDFIGILDKEINDYFSEFNNKFGKSIFKIQTPVLSDFIIQNTPHNTSHIEFAIHLKTEKSILKYKKYIEDLENSLEKREWKKLNELIELSHDIVKNTVSLDKQSIGTLGMSISPFPSFSFSKPISLKKRNVHLVFLENLSRFAFDGRRIE